MGNAQIITLVILAAIALADYDTFQRYNDFVGHVLRRHLVLDAWRLARMEGSGICDREELIVLSPASNQH